MQIIGDGNVIITNYHLHAEQFL